MRTIGSAVRLSLVYCLTAGCDEASLTPDSGIEIEVDSGTVPRADAGRDSGLQVEEHDSGPPDAGGDVFRAFAPCDAVEDYVVESGAEEVTIFWSRPDGTNYVYDRPCRQIPVGTQVLIGVGIGHALVRSARGDVATSPFPASPTEEHRTYLFDTPGYYPFYCTQHGDDTGAGMAGVVWVVP